jgi:acetyl esterase/lipase
VYQYLLDNGIPASRILVSGDSTGEHIAIALLRYLTGQRIKEMPCPADLLLWSSLVDLCAQTDPDTTDLHRNSKTDYITGFTLAWGIGEYIPKFMKLDSEHLSPLKHPFRTQTPIWVMVGGVEVLHGGIVRFVKNMRDMKENKVEMYEAPYTNYDIFKVGNLLGWNTRLVALPVLRMNSCKGKQICPCVDRLLAEWFGIKIKHQSILAIKPHNPMMILGYNRTARGAPMSKTGRCRSC